MTYLNKQCWIDWHKRGIQSVTERAKRSFFAGKRDVGLKGLFQSLYLLGDQLFHGCSTDQGRRNREALSRAVRVLEKLVPIFRTITKQQMSDSRLIQLVSGIPYPSSVGGIG